jgi:hypothetical protein
MSLSMHGTARRNAVTLAELPTGTCRWPVGLNDDGEHVFCSAPVTPIERPGAQLAARIAAFMQRVFERNVCNGSYEVYDAAQLLAVA